MFRNVLFRLIPSGVFISLSLWLYFTSNEYKDIYTNPINKRSNDVCGTWQQAYTDLHNDILGKKSEWRVLVSVSVEAGLADRISGIISEFFIALLSNRAFLLLSFEDLPSFDLAYTSSNIQCKWKEEYMKYFVGLNFADSSFNKQRSSHVHHLITPLRWTYDGLKGVYDPLVVNTSHYRPIYAINQNDIVDKLYSGHFDNDQPPETPYLTNTNISSNPDRKLLKDWPELWIVSNRGRTVRMFENPHYGKKLRDLGLTPETAFGCAFRYLFTPNKEVIDRYRDYISILDQPNILKIGISIRVGDRVFREDINQTKEKIEEEWNKVDSYFKCAKEIEETRKTEKQSVIWYLMADSLLIRREAKKRYQNKILTDVDTIYGHTRFRENKIERDNITKTAFEKNTMENVAGNLLLFSMTDYHIIPLHSGFGRTGAFLSLREHRIYQISSNNKRNCGLWDYDSTLHIASSWEGI